RASSSAWHLRSNRGNDTNWGTAELGTCPRPVAHWSALALALIGSARPRLLFVLPVFAARGQACVDNRPRPRRRPGAMTRQGQVPGSPVPQSVSFQRELTS